MSNYSLTSKNINDIMIDSYNKINDLNVLISKEKNNIDDKMKLLECQTEYLNYLLSKGKTSDDNLILFSDNLFLQGEQYGATVFPEYNNIPYNLFNLKVEGSDKTFFRQDVSVSVNNTIIEYNDNILKNNEEYYFKLFNENTIDIVITINNKMLGPSSFNAIEIDPIFYGNFHISSLEISYYNDENKLDTKKINEEVIENVGKYLILLDKKYNLYQLHLKVNLNYKSGYENGKYPFGIKHIYFYNTITKNDSYAILKLQKDKSIYSVSNNIKIKTPFGYKDTSIDEEQIEIYTDYIDGNLLNRVYPTYKNTTNEIPKATKELYFKVPLKKQSYIAIKFDIQLR